MPEKEITMNEYEGTQNSPIYLLASKHLMATIAKLVPPWIHPNFLTLGTLMVSLSIFMIHSYYDYYLYASSAYYPEYSEIPNWVWLYTGLGVLLEYILDGIDGVHARNTDSTSPVGEFLDHSIDAIRICLVHPLCLFSIFGRADYGFIPINILHTVILIQLVMFLMVWFQLLTGALLIPWVYDFMQLLFVVFNLSTWYLGGSYTWKRFLAGWSNADLFCYGSWVGCVCVSMPIQIHHAICNWSKRKRKYVTFQELCPMIWFCTVILCSYLWCATASKDSKRILNVDPRLFLTAEAITFSDLMSHLIPARMKGQVPYTHGLSIIFTAVTIIGISLPKKLSKHQWHLLLIYTIFAVFAHAGFLIDTVRNMCNEFGISWYKVRPSEKEEEPAKSKLKVN